MRSAFYPDPAEFQRNVSRLCRELEAIAFKAGATEADCDDPQSLFAALPFLPREEASKLLGARAGNADPGLALAASYLLSLAREVWSTAPTSSPAAAAAARSATG
jgi:hypothetical protein